MQAMACRRSRTWLALMIGCAACGRIGFDDLAVRDGAAEPGDGAVDGMPDASPCGFSCEIQYTSNVTTCGASPITYMLIAPGDPFVLRADLTGYSSLEVALEVCDPTGIVFQLADSPSSTLVRGDGGDFSNNAHLVIETTAVTVFPNDDGPVSPLDTVTDYLAASGCTTRTLTVSDQSISDSEGLQISSPYALRLSPPSDALGTPDRIWYIGINRVVRVSSIETGLGLATARFCLR
jgi:hypothetical protein